MLARKGRQAFRGTRKGYLGAGGIGLLLLLGGNGGVMIAEDRGLPSGLTALLIAVVPLYVVLLRVLFKDRPTRRTVIGIALGFVGLAVLLLPGTRPDGVKRLRRRDRPDRQPAVGHRLGPRVPHRAARGPAGRDRGADPRRRDRADRRRARQG